MATLKCIRWGLGLICLIVGLTGCLLFDHTAKEIAERRKTGDVKGAREQAVEVLKESPRKMDVWRELALTDVSLCRLKPTDHEDVMPTLVEAALICAAVTQHQNGKPNDEWKAAGNQIAVEMANYAGHLMSRLEVKTTRTVSHSETWVLPDNMPDRLREMLEDQFRENGQAMENRFESQTYLDPDAISDVVRREVVLSELLKRLPCDDAKLISVTMEQLDRKILWSTSDSNISSSFVNANREAALNAVIEGLRLATDQLESQRYFDPSTILENKILE